MTKRTKIIATIGPASESPEILRRMMRAGMNVARLNFSHGSYDEHAARIKTIRALAAEEKMNIAIMLDTKGPEIRTGRYDQKVEIISGDTFTLHTKEIMGDAHNCSVSFKDLPHYVNIGDNILASDGLLSFRVTEVKLSEGQIVCRIENGGMIGDRKNMNVPGISIPMPFLADKDLGDVKFGADNQVDFIAASFTRSAQDVLELRSLLKSYGAPDVRIIAKIENHEGIDNFEEILSVVDGVMVARGDLGVEIPLEKVPLAQKSMTEQCRKAGKFVITATQMLDSMIVNPRPTRAEVSDVSYAVMQGVSAVMLSGESAAGKYPVEAVAMMARIAVTAEESMDYWKLFYSDAPLGIKFDEVGPAIARAACDVAATLGAKAILVMTQTGYTAAAISRWRPGCPIIVEALTDGVLRQTALMWGATGFLRQPTTDFKDMIVSAITMAKENGYVSDGDLVIITGGTPNVGGSTNMLRAHCVGDEIL